MMWRENKERERDDDIEKRNRKRESGKDLSGFLVSRTTLGHRRRL